jgi:ABC-type phosphate/phosphonate transport system substrate-binding protein
LHIKERCVIDTEHHINWRAIGLLLVVLLGSVACGGRTDETPVPTSIPPTSTPAPTPLPPLPTVAPLGSQDNPLVMLFVTPDPEEVLTAAGVLSDRLSSGDVVVDVQLTQSYAEAYHAICDGSAQVVSLNAFATLAAQEAGCGEALYVLEVDEETATQGQMITAVGRNVFTVEGFRGQIFCRPSANSVEGWIIPGLTMQTRGLDPLADLAGVVDSGSDEDVVNMIYSRECNVGATTLGAHEDIPNPNPTRSGRILVIEELVPVPHDAVLLTTSVGDSVRALLLDLLHQSEDDIAGLLGADALAGVDEETFAALADLFDDAGVSAAAMSE